MPCRAPALGTPRDAALGVSCAGPRPSEGDLESSGCEPLLGWEAAVANRGNRVVQELELQG